MDTAYADPAQADRHHAARPTSAAWAALSAADKAARLVAASDYLDAAYRFKGRKTRPDQTRQFPRNGAAAVPPEVVKAVCELALLLPEGGAAAASAAVQLRKRVKVGEIETEYQQASAADSRRFPLIDGLLADWLLPDGLRTGMILAGGGRV